MGRVAVNCKDWKEEERCDEDFSDILKDVSGGEKITARHLCVKTCGKDGKKRGLVESGWRGWVKNSLGNVWGQRKFQLAAVLPFGQTSSMWVGAAVPLAATMIAAGVVVQVVRRARD